MKLTEIGEHTIATNKRQQENLLFYGKPYHATWEACEDHLVVEILPNIDNRTTREKKIAAFKAARSRKPKV